MPRHPLLALLSLLSLVSILAGCGTPAAMSSPDTGTDAASADDVGTDDGGADAASLPDAGADAGTTEDVGVDASIGEDGGPPPPEHLLFSEIATSPGTAELFEIWNPTSAPISLDDYYVSDNAVYYEMASGTAWTPATSSPGTDFLFGFPAGTTLAAGAVLVVALDPGFETRFGACPDFIADTTPYTCTSGTAAAVRVPTNGLLDPTHHGALLSDAREMLVLFRWDGASSVVTDVDYVTWGTTFDAGQSRVDKTGVGAYASDTAAASQLPALAPTSGQSIARCGGEIGETLTGGNGIGGHDETSEHLDVAFGALTTPTPGTQTGCP